MSEMLNVTQGTGEAPTRRKDLNPNITELRLRILGYEIRGARLRSI